MSACAGCKLNLKCEFTEPRKSASRLCRCAIARRHACSLCAATGTVAPGPPLLDGRKSVASITRVNMCASIGVSGIARSANRLRRCAIARRNARSLCAATGTVAPPPRLLDGRKSVSSSAHANMRATTDGAETPRSGNSLPRCAIALGYSPRPCARSRKHRRPPARLSMVESRSRRAPTPTCAKRPTGPKPRGPATACPVAQSLSATLPDRAPARVSTADPVCTPFIDGRKSVAS